MMLFMSILGLFIGSALGGLALWLLATHLAKISTATYGNSFKISFITNALNYGIWYLIGEDAMKLELEGMFIVSVLLLSFTYIILGKIIWKCSWMQSLRANILWILVYAILIGFALSKAM
jgi:hypothetical protein